MAAPSRWASQAALDAFLRFNPQKQALQEQIAQANQAYKASVAAGAGTAKDTEASVRASIPALQAAFAQAKAATAPTTTLVSQQLAQLPGDTAQYRANQAAAGQTFLANLAASGASAQKTMLERIPRAREGAQFNQLSAHNQLIQQLGQIFGRQQNLGAEAGAYAQGVAEKLEAEAEGRRVTEQGHRETRESAREGHQDVRQTAAENRQQRAETAKEGREAREAIAAEGNRNRREIAQEKGRGGKSGRGFTAPGVETQSPDAHNKARDNIENIRREAYEYRNEHRNYNQAKEDLEHPVPSSVKNKAGKTIQTGEGRKAYPYNAQLKAGLDLAYFGGVGEGTAGLLHNEGFGVGRLGYPIYKAPPQPSPAQRSLGLLQSLGQAFR